MDLQKKAGKKGGGGSIRCPRAHKTSFPPPRKTKGKRRVLEEEEETRAECQEERGGGGKKGGGEGIQLVYTSSPKSRAVNKCDFPEKMPQIKVKKSEKNVLEFIFPLELNCV